MDNVDFTKDLGVTYVACSKYKGRDILNLCQTEGVFKLPRDFGAGICSKAFGEDFKQTWNRVRA